MESIVTSGDISSAVVDFSLLSLFLKADLVVKSVIIILMAASIYSWAVIVEKLVKLKKKHSVISLWDETAELAKKEGKTPVIALCEKNRPGFWVMVHSSDLNKLKKDK